MYIRIYVCVYMYVYVYKTIGEYNFPRRQEKSYKVHPETLSSVHLTVVIKCSSGQGTMFDAEGSTKNGNKHHRLYLYRA